MKAKIRYADNSDSKKIIYFFNKNFSIQNDGIWNEEFICPYGIKASISRKQMIVVDFNGEIIGALRFYKRKKDDIISLYQFALDEKIRGKSIIEKMLNFLGDKGEIIEAMCLLEAKFNNYYKKKNWSLVRTNDKYNYFQYKI
ncbi:MAG: hypothetical protein N4A38_05270 [Candidatus Gracilibacteria bacterium]|nr:hypothetical protein [Candidatus Gracilibacteria bacterium]